MKIRTGFVSNSSASSFCLYGFRFDDNDSAWKMVEMMRRHGIKDAIYVEGQFDDYFAGVGNNEFEIDHAHEDWRYYRSPSPSQEQIKSVDEFSEKLKIEPKPKSYQDTWYEG